MSYFQARNSFLNESYSVKKKQILLKTSCILLRTPLFLLLFLAFFFSFPDTDKVIFIVMIGLNCASLCISNDVEHT